MRTTRAFMMSLLLAAFALPAAGWSPIGLSVGFSDSSSNKDRYSWSKEKVDIFGFPGRTDAVYGFRLNFFGGANNTMYGLAVALFGNGGYTRDSQKNFADGDIAGIEVACVQNVAETAHNGAWQLCALQNMLLDGGDIVQIAGFFNEIRGDSTGMQLAGIENKISASFEGVQLAGVYNRVDGELNGVQMGFFNSAGSLCGVQIGVVNYVERNFSGVQLGALNIFSGSKAEILPLLRAGF